MKCKNKNCIINIIGRLYKNNNKNKENNRNICKQSGFTNL